MVSQGVGFLYVCVWGAFTHHQTLTDFFYVFPALIPEDSLLNSEEWNGTERIDNLKCSQIAKIFHKQFSLRACFEKFHFQ